MQEYNFSSLHEFLNGWQNNSDYLNMLRRLAQLSRLFSENDAPYLNYRLTENIFCRYFPAINDARSCTPYDVRLNQIGIGIKTFVISGNSSMEKIAEFNQLSSQLSRLKNIELARKLGELRNDRIRMANEVYNVTESQYHIVGRKPGLLRIFNTPYEEIDIDKISNVKDKKASITFDDGMNEYSFNKSKSALQKRFYLPSVYKDVEICVIKDPYRLIEDLFNYVVETEIQKKDSMIKGKDYVVLPLYSVRDKCVPEHSGLNQWNAKGRPRHEDEIYIPVPKNIHENYPEFFPQTKDETFIICLPNGKKLSAKMCQSGLKGLMSNPNKELGNWLLRKVLKKLPGELVTMDDLHRYGIDSVLVERKPDNSEGRRIYSVSFSNEYERFEDFIDE